MKWAAQEIVNTLKVFKERYFVLGLADKVVFGHSFDSVSEGFSNLIDSVIL